MGDLIEFRTWPNHQRKFHAVTSGGIMFWLKTHRSVIVGLSTNPNEDCTYELIIEPRKCTLKSSTGVYSTNAPNILSGLEFRKFFILWSNNTIVFWSETTVFLSWRYSIENFIQYVTFCSDQDAGMAEWKCYLPPVSIADNPPLKRLEGGEPRWIQVKYTFQLPEGAIIGGFENEFLYIMRAPYRGSLIPGKFVPSVGLGFITWGSETHKCPIVEILCGFNCTWVKCQENRIPAGAVEGGYSEIDREILYVGRVYYKGHLIIGNIQPSHRCCFFTHMQKTKTERFYEILVAPKPKPNDSVSNDSDEEDLIDDNIHLWLDDDDE